jgi:hypothetical protein
MRGLRGIGIDARMIQVGESICTGSDSKRMPCHMQLVGYGPNRLGIAEGVSRLGLSAEGARVGECVW